MDGEQTRRSFLSKTIKRETGLLILRKAKSVCGCQANEKTKAASIGVGGQGLTNFKAFNLGNIGALCDESWRQATETFNPSPTPRIAGFQDLKVFLPAVKVVNKPEADEFLRWRRYQGRTLRARLNQPLQ